MGCLNSIIFRAWSLTWPWTPMTVPKKKHLRSNTSRTNSAKHCTSTNNPQSRSATKLLPLILHIHFSIAGSIRRLQRRPAGMLGTGAAHPARPLSGCAPLGHYHFSLTCQPALKFFLHCDWLTEWKWGLFWRWILPANLLCHYVSLLMYISHESLFAFVVLFFRKK